MAAPTSDDVAKGGPERIRDADRTRTEILDTAAREFAEKGFDGARVDEIAAKTRTTKRMIYYYFTNKDQLFVEVLERAYTVIRSLEQNLDVEHLDPAEAIRQLAGLTFDHHESHPDFVRLVSIENIHRAEHIARSKALSNLANPALDVLTRILARGRETGQFRDDVDALDVHMAISAFCVFRTANRYTFNAIFDRDMLDPAHRDHHRRMVADMLVSYLTTR
ncbi:TetR/AcrR family transcriptional regulator [Amycolatopsis sp. DG1A-15b]|uniref:TetR/AcrR family transcriptional regulator n=1 Tax=Amycolatopsis sp. DG1A-15b TaxID=3052846 RepID=UPI00255BD586|nr:TetR/AcrR family transcriptional regulator [Amycolatopsis sp. DG1A-15b]WIX92380.1 TetR/AcrR family transcriptional regulator [Amycolatopsis sp. DG1A-15b]